MRTKYFMILCLLSLFTQGVSAQTGTQNYLQTRTYTNDAGTAYLDEIVYVDGLGRPVQTVQKGIISAGNDLVSHQEYDAFGRPSNTWLPAVASGNNGAFVPLVTLKGKSSSTYGEGNAYSKTVYEPSPLNRITGQAGPGQDWHNNNKQVQTGYLANDTSTYVCRWYRVGDTRTDNQVTILSGKVNYPAGVLPVTRLTNEDNAISYEFRDKLGQLLLTRQMEGSLAHDTYYIYDSFGNLRIVLPPLASEAMAAAGTWAETHTTLKDYAYLYKYDSRNRCIAKKLPGAEWVYYVYDHADRLIFTQDGEMRTQGGKWMFSIPDALERIVLTGTCTNTMNYLENPLGTNVVKTVRNNATDTCKGYITPIGVALISPVVLSVSYYDDYAFLGSNSIPNNTDTQYTTESGFGVCYGDHQTSNKYKNKGFLTGTLTAQLNPDGTVSSTYLYAVMYYDNRGRVIQTKSNNHLPGGMEKEYIAYNFTNQPVKRKHVHSATGKTTLTELYDYQYDHAGRLEKTTHQLTEGTTAKPPIVLVFNTYDELGRLKQSSSNDQINLASSYVYNVRSWLKSVNTPLFKENLTFTYSGNIATQQWTQAGKTRNYSFGYDALSRLTAATYSDNETATGSAKPNYSASYGYDKQGNITRISRYGNTGTTTYGAIDRLRLEYSGNQLLQVTDSAANPTLSASADFRKISTAAGTTYAYDANGNLKRDPNKGITNIEYNVLNLPLSVAINNTLGQITNTYVYTAGGKKLSVSKGSFKTDYVGNIIYENGALKRILVDNGYYENGMYYFYVRDHLGNNRVVANQDGNTVQSTQYYPFGMAFADGLEPSKQPYKYNGKELDSDKGLNLYDYEARHMDPALGRFMTMDPLAEKYYSISPYTYCVNNPINHVDLRGDTITTVVTSSINGVTTNTTYYYGKDVNGNYGFIDSSGQMYSGSDQFVADLTTALANLSSKSTGAGLVNDLASSTTNTVQIMKARSSQSNAADPKGQFIIFDPSSSTGGVNTAGNENRPSFIGLGHEMAHIQDTWKGTIDNSTWVSPLPGVVIPNSEKYATHIENRLRAEHGVPLRTHYGIDATSGVRVGLESTRIVEGLAFSKFYTQPVSSNIPSLRMPFKYR